MWNRGSLLGFFLILQILSRLLLTIFYNSSITMAFNSIVILTDDINFRFIIRSIHINRASIVIMIVYFHLWRRLYYKGYKKKLAWIIRLFIIYLIIIVAFLGYVLPWRQISFWRATVITSLLSVFPIGSDILNWIWRGFAVSGPTLSRFYTLHFIIPLILIPLSILHLFFIHEKRSNNPIRVYSNSLKINFWPYYIIKDLLGIILLLLFFFFLFFFFQYYLESLIILLNLIR